MNIETMVIKDASTGGIVDSLDSFKGVETEYAKTNRSVTMLNTLIFAHFMRFVLFGPSHCRTLESEPNGNQFSCEHDCLFQQKN